MCCKLKTKIVGYKMMYLVLDLELCQKSDQDHIDILTGLE